MWLQRNVEMAVFLTVVDGSSGFFLNHKLLIKESYQQFVSGDTNNYVLKDDIFIFTEKEKPAPREQRKRKKPKRTSVPTEHSTASLEQVKQTVDLLIKECQEHIPSTNGTRSSDIDQILEDSIVFPNLRGKNDTNSCVITTISNRQFIVPPNCSFYNGDIRELSNILPNETKFDFIVLDPPWRNKYIRRLKTARSELSYKMIYDEDLADIPLEQYIHESTLVVIWCTNSSLHQKAIMEAFLPRWNLKLLAKWYWIKLNHKGELVGPFKEAGQKQPFEQIFITSHQGNSNFCFKEEFVLSVASTIHSHKPPLFELFKHHLPKDPKCLELFARYLCPAFTSVGLEVLKLQDVRLYNLEKDVAKRQSK